MNRRGFFGMIAAVVCGSTQASEWRYWKANPPGALDRVRIIIDTTGMKTLRGDYVAENA